MFAHGYWEMYLFVFQILGIDLGYHVELRNNTILGQFILALLLLSRQHIKNYLLKVQYLHGIIYSIRTIENLPDPNKSNRIELSSPVTFSLPATTLPPAAPENARTATTNPPSPQAHRTHHSPSSNTPQPCSIIYAAPRAACSH